MFLKKIISFHLIHDLFPIITIFISQYSPGSSNRFDLLNRKKSTEVASSAGKLAPGRTEVGG